MANTTIDIKLKIKHSIWFDLIKLMSFFKIPFPNRFIKFLNGKRITTLYVNGKKECSYYFDINDLTPQI